MENHSSEVIHEGGSEGDVAGFISKTFEILSVIALIHRMRSTPKSYIGGYRENSLSLRMSINFNRLCYRNSSDTGKSTASSDSSTCTAFTNHVKTTPSVFSVTPSSCAMAPIYSRP
jgi:hypothetical protein